jgi:DNA-binding NarL/FixJ family response regulator
MPLCDASTVTARLLLVDDHAGFRRAARALLTAAGWDVVGEAATAADALALHAALHPDVVLLDVALPDGNGFDLVASFAGADVVLISSRDWSEIPARTHAAGARGFLRKETLSGPALAELVG